MRLAKPIAELPKPSRDEWEQVKAELPVGRRLTGRVVWVPRPGTIGIGVDIGMEAPAFADVLSLPPNAKDWPSPGETTYFMVLGFADHNRQVRVAPAEADESVTGSRSAATRTERLRGATAEDWDRIDELLFDGRRIQAAHALREHFGPMTIHETIVALGERFEHLRQNHPESFNVSLDGYWDRFYS